jgi:hypothetical protein
VQWETVCKNEDGFWMVEYGSYEDKRATKVLLLEEAAKPESKIKEIH